MSVRKLRAVRMEVPDRLHTLIRTGASEFDIPKSSYAAAVLWFFLEKEKEEAMTALTEYLEHVSKNGPKVGVSPPRDLPSPEGFVG